MSSTVHLHVGVAKTGTTYLQGIMFRNRRLLAENGVLFPGRRRASHFHGSLDVRNVRFHGHAYPEADGAWAKLVGEVNAYTGRSAVISHETLARTPDALIREVVDSFATDDIRVVLTARDLGRQIPAVWQERVKNRSRQTYPQFLQEIFVSPPAKRFEGDFWQPQWLPGVLRRWVDAVGADRVTVVTVPPRAADPQELWRRFSTALDLPDLDYDFATDLVNTSLGGTEAELLRRLNAELDGLEWPEYARRIKHGFVEGKLADIASSPRIVVPGRWHQRLDRLSGITIDRVTSLGVRVVGDLDDLRPRLDADTPEGPTEVAEQDLLGLTTRLVADYAAASKPEPHPPPPSSLLAKVRSRIALRARLRRLRARMTRG